MEPKSFTLLDIISKVEGCGDLREEGGGGQGVGWRSEEIGEVGELWRLQGGRVKVSPWPSEIVKGVKVEITASQSIFSKIT